MHLRSLNSLTTKMIVLVCVLVLSTTLLIALRIVNDASQFVLKASVEGLADETRRVAQHFDSTYDSLRNDVLIAANTPPIQGIIRSSRHNNIDPLDGSSYSQWRKRLASIFTSIMQAHPYYVQMHYIGAGNNGREIVRVNATPSGLMVVSSGKLQEKGDEAYFKDVAKDPKAHTYFSAVSLNREHGKVDSNQVRVLRVMRPVFDSDGIFFGMVVINIDYEKLLMNSLQQISSDVDILIQNHAGDYMLRTANGNMFMLDKPTDITTIFADILPKIQTSDQQEVYHISDKRISYGVKLEVDAYTPNSYLTIVTSGKRKEYLQLSSLITQAVLLIFIAILIAYLITRWFIAPLKVILHEVRNYKEEQGALKLPVKTKDEIGELGESFQRLTNLLLESQQKSKAILENVVDGIITIDMRGVIDSCNPACEKIFGYPISEMIGKNVSMLMPDPHILRHDGYLRHYLAVGEKKIIGSEREVEGKRRDGTLFPMELSVSEVVLNDRLLFTGVIRDITERKQLEEVKNSFISTVSHELRTPLTSIQGALGLIKHKAAKTMDEASLQLITIGYESCERLTRLINDVLDLEKISAGKIVFNIKRHELIPMVEKAVESQNALAKKHKLSFKLEVPDDQLFCEVDADRLTQVLVNLMSNACKFSPAGKAVTVRVEREGVNACISVIDKGPGIPKAFQTKIFEPFSQADSSSTRNVEGSGLGLSIAKSIVEEMGGSIHFETKARQGTRFYFFLPLK